MHEEVKLIVHEMFDAGEIANYSREDNGTFFQYVPDPVVVDPSSGSSNGPWSILT